MKTTLTTIAIATVLSVSTLITTAQNILPKQTLTVLAIDATRYNSESNSEQVGNIVRMELEKLNDYQVMDKYDVAYMVEKNKVKTENCFGKICLIEIGEIIKSDKVLSGSIEKFPKSITYTLRLIDIKSKSIEKTTVMEFLNLPEELQNMTMLTVQTMFNKPVDQNLLIRLTKIEGFDNTNNNPNKERLRLDGPRLGFVGLMGNTGKIMQESKSSGGYGGYPVMFQFGYQFEKQYLNEGNIQALFEFLPMITGLDQGLFIPSFSLLHGVRSNVNGWEVAMGPTINVIKKAYGYYDDKNDWQLEGTWAANKNNFGIVNPNEIEERMDSRGDLKFNTGFILAFGRTFKSGRLNLPVNAYVVPAKSGVRVGVSLGFNGKNKTSN
jgi:hypothetical protein